MVIRVDELKVVFIEKAHKRAFSSFLADIRLDAASRVNSLCRSGINECYVLETLGSKTDVIAIVEDHGEICSFALAERKKNHLFLHLLCSSKNAPKGTGKKLMESVIQYAKKEGYDYLQLMALDHVVGFYLQFGFRFGGHTIRRDEKEIFKIEEELRLKTKEVDESGYGLNRSKYIMNIFKRTAYYNKNQTSMSLDLKLKPILKKASKTGIKKTSTTKRGAKENTNLKRSSTDRTFRKSTMQQRRY
jgi:GNAT superfamily N-acetyltransferase